MEPIREVVIIYAFYADVFWLNSFLVNWAVLLIAERIHKKIGWAVLFAVLGALLEVMMLIGLHSYHMYLALSILVIIPLMCLLVRFPKRRLELVRYLLCCYGVTILLGGISLALDNYVPWRRTTCMASLLGVLLADLLVRLLYQAIKIKRHCMELCLQNRGRIVECRGLIDTGNLLCDPYAHQPIQLAGASLLRKLGVRREQFVGMLPYQSLGRDGVIAFYRIERMELRDGEGTRLGVVEGPLLADAGERIFGGKPYELIINEKMTEYLI